MIWWKIYLLQRTTRLTPLPRSPKRPVTRVAMPDNQNFHSCAYQCKCCKDFTQILLFGSLVCRRIFCAKREMVIGVFDMPNPFNTKFYLYQYFAKFPYQYRYSHKKCRYPTPRIALFVRPSVGDKISAASQIAQFAWVHTAWAPEGRKVRSQEARRASN